MTIQYCKILEVEGPYPKGWNRFRLKEIKLNRSKILGEVPLQNTAPANFGSLLSIDFEHPYLTDVDFSNTVYYTA